MTKRGKGPRISRAENPVLAQDTFFKKTTFNWVGKKVLLDIQKQGSCCCCWAFAYTGSITALDAIIRKREVIPLSKQQLLDCMFKHYPMPELEAKLERRECFGLSRRMAYIFAKEQGIVEESKYHYIMERSKCKCPRDAEIYMGPTEEETRIATSGDENKKAVLHALIIVGYGEVNGEAFYLVQNSWGKKWGYKGFAKIKQSLAIKLSYPFIDEEKKE